MKYESMNAPLMGLFARAYHTGRFRTKIFHDPLAQQLLSDREFRQITDRLSDGIPGFIPGYRGQTLLQRAVNRHLAPIPLGRAAFTEDALKTAVLIGAEQYLILGAGYDTFALRRPDWAQKLRIFEIDHPVPAADKQQRLRQAGITPPENVHFISADLPRPDWPALLTGHGHFDPQKTSFCSLTGLVHELSAQGFDSMLVNLSRLLPADSSLVFDYPSGSCSGRTPFSYTCVERLLSGHGFRIYEHLTPPELAGRFFESFNFAYPRCPIATPEGVSFCLAVRK